MKKIILLVAFVLLVFPFASRAFSEVEIPIEEHVSSFHSTPIEEEEPLNSYHSYAADDPNEFQSPYNNFYYSYLPLWIVLWNENQSRTDSFDTHDHFPYIIAIDKSTKEYQLFRYIGPNNQNEKVSPQEAAGLPWLQKEIVY